MDQADALPSPMWRSPLAIALAGWMAAVLAVTLASSRLLELLPWPVIPIVAIGLFLVPIPFLLVWGFWTMLREPVTGWLPPTVLLAFCGGFVPVSPLLFEAGVRLNFAAHRPAYEAIVADARTGRPVAVGTLGERDGIVYALSSRRPDVVQFRWSRSPDMDIMVVHDPANCGRPAVRGTVSAYRYELGGAYCYYRSGP